MVAIAGYQRVPVSVWEIARSDPEPGTGTVVEECLRGGQAVDRTGTLGGGTGLGDSERQSGPGCGRQIGGCPLGIRGRNGAASHGARG